MNDANGKARVIRILKTEEETDQTITHDVAREEHYVSLQMKVH